MESEYKLSVFNVTQTSTPAGRTSENGLPAGDTVRKLISDHWDKCERIVVSFDGIAKMTRPFMDEAFAKLLETHTLEEFNKKVFFPDASDGIVKALNEAFKLRLKIMQAQKEREGGI
ncbi:MAG: STAS-like domain-containing protein [Nitrospinae bacterium]|nr:STAS-like domain-containing protein [Nitrospinota bacterium]